MNTNLATLLNSRIETLTSGLNIFDQVITAFESFMQCQVTYLSLCNFEYTDNASGYTYRLSTDALTNVDPRITVLVLKDSEITAILDIRADGSEKHEQTINIEDKSRMHILDLFAIIANAVNC